MTEEIKIAGFGIAPEVLATLVTRAVEGVEGIASVGVRDLAANLVSMFSSKGAQSGPAVEASVVDDELAIRVHVVVFFGYPFKQLAEAVREAVAKAVDAQVGVGVARVDVCIDGLVFPKE
ncbi:MAG: Asp23/Gls24 family envelope stress response protein [Coriobacteriaceae bacterium]|nr:Asp23/Gls24 family envelope stress response protein [Coriobacteriaceae bacterium]